MRRFRSLFRFAAARCALGARHSPIWLAAASLVLFAAAVSHPVRAQSVVAFDSGWYSDQGRYSNGENQYTGTTSVEEHHGFMVFDIPAGDEIVGVSLQVFTWEVRGGPNTIGVYDFSGDINALIAATDGRPSAAGVAIYEDLGSGIQFGTAEIADSNATVLIPLNAQAVSALNAARGGQLAVGFRNLTIDQVQDAVFSSSGRSTSNALIIERIDIIAPTLTISGPGTPQNGPFSIDFNFSEPVADFTAEDISIMGAELANFSGSGANYTATVIPTLETNIQISVGTGRFRDTSSNANPNVAEARFNAVADRLRPDVSLTGPAGTISGSFEVEINFSEVVTGFELLDIQILRGSAADLTGSGAAYRVTVVPDGSGQPVTVFVPAGVAIDAATNTNVSSAPLVVTTDVAVPAITTLAPSSGTAAGGTSVTITGTDFTGATGVSFGGTAASAFTVNSATSVTATAPAGTGTVDVTVTTAAGTSDTAGTGNDYTYIGVSGIGPASLSSASVASPYSASLSATDCVGPCTFAITAGALPAGLTLSSAGILSGTPTAGGVFNFTVTVTDAGAGGLTVNRAYSLTVGAPTIVVTPTTVPAATRGFAFSRTFSATGGVGSYTYAVSAGALPAGTTLTAAGVLSGTPTVTGAFNFTVRATDQSTGSGPYSGTVPVTLVVSGAVISVTPTSLPAVMAGLPYEQVMSATGGSGAYSYTVTAGALPSGIILIQSGSGAGRLVGSSYSPGTFNFTVTATDAFSNTGSVALSLTIQSRPDPSQDPDVRGINQAQAEAVRRLTSTQIDNFSRRLEDLRDGTAGSSQGIRLQSGLADLGLQADARTRFGGGRVFEQQAIDPDRADLNAMLWRGAETTGTTGTAGVTNASMSGQPVLGMGNSLGLGGAPASFGSLGGTAQGEQGTDPAGGVRLWTGGSITIGDRDAETGQPSMSVTSSGLSVGADIALSPTFDLGFGGGLGEENTDVGSRDSRVESKTFVGVVYGSWRPQGGVYIDGMLGYGSLSFDMDRRVAIDSSLVTGSRDGTAVFGSLGLGFDRLFGTGRLSTYGRLESLNAELDAYTEVGSPFWALSYAERDVESLQGVIGTRYAWSRINRDSVWTPSVRAEYRQELAEGGLQSLRYADWAGGPVYQIDQSSWDRGELNLGFGLNVQTNSGWTATGELGGRMSDGQSLGTVRLGLSRKF